MATITPKELAAKLETDPKTVRKFLRSKQGLDMKVGKGHRWAIESREVRGLKSRFSKWNAERLQAIADAKAARAEAARDAADDAEVTDDDASDEVILED